MLHHAKVDLPERIRQAGRIPPYASVLEDDGPHNPSPPSHPDAGTEYDIIGIWTIDKTFTKLDVDLQIHGVLDEWAPTLSDLVGSGVRVKWVPGWISAAEFDAGLLDSIVLLQEPSVANGRSILARERLRTLGPYTL